MKKTSLVEAKAHLSELVDLAEHHGERILILRHGKPAAALVPVEAASAAASRARRRMTEEEVDTLFASFGDVRAADAVAALSAERSRVDGAVTRKKRRR